MGLCHDFGPQIAEGCNHPMRAGSDSCTCDVCGVVCQGRFDGCGEVWARGPHPVLLKTPAPPADDLVPAPIRLRSVPNTPEPAAGDEAGDEAADDIATAVAIEALRDEIVELRRALAREQSLAADPVSASKVGAGPDTDSIRATIDAAVRTAMRKESVALGDAVAALLEGVRRDMVAMRQTYDEGLTAMKELVAEVGVARADLPVALAKRFDGLQDANDENVAVLRELVADVAAATSALSTELGRLDAGNRKAFRAALAEDMRPIIEVVAESVAQADVRLTALDEKVDELTESTTVLAEAVAEVIETLADANTDDRPVRPVLPTTPRPPGRPPADRAFPRARPGP